MCGLTGFWLPGETEAVLRWQVEQMADTLIHRGPDDRGSWVDAPAGMALGFRRLSIIDVSSAGHQPMVSLDGRYVIAFNGEIYNYLELRAELTGRVRRFRGHSDTEVLLEACATWGVEPTLKRLVGMFAVVLWDKEEQVLTLARDRLGKKPLYYGQSDDVFLFGSELKALRAHPRFSPEIDRDALALYLRYGYIPSPRSILRGIRKLPPGHYAVVPRSRIPQVRCYWSGQDVVEQSVANRLQLTDAQATEQLDALLGEAVKRRLVSDVPLGAFLSGGIDSSTVVALMHSERGCWPLRTGSLRGRCVPYSRLPTT